MTLPTLTEIQAFLDAVNTAITPWLPIIVTGIVLGLSYVGLGRLLRSGR